MGYMEVSSNGGTPESSILMVCSIKNHPFWGTPIYETPHIMGCTMGCTMVDMIDYTMDTMGHHIYDGILWGGVYINVLLSIYEMDI